MHDDETPTDAELVRSLIREQFPEWATLEVRALPFGGTDHALYRLGDDLLIRLPRMDWAASQADTDARILPLLAPHLAVETPVPRGLGAPGAGYPWPWSVVPWIAGAPPQRGDARLTTLAEELAAFLGELRSIPAAVDAALVATDRGAPLALRDQPTHDAIAESRDLFPADAEAAWADLVATPASTDAPRWLHGDLKPGNLLVDDGHLTAVIDWAPVAIGDPAVDLIPAWMLFDGDSRDRFRAATGCDADGWRRGQAWALSISVFELPYYLTRAPEIAAAAAATIAAVLTDWRGTR